MKAVILERLKGNFILNVDELFEAINKELNYNWLITNFDGTQDFADTFYNGDEYMWISGDDFTKYLKKNTVQFIWGVISGFKKDIKLSELLKYPLPYADGNKEIWDTNICTQNPLAEIEIIAWDSTLAIVISKDDEVIEMIKKYYPKAKNLFEYNMTLK